MIVFNFNELAQKMEEMEITRERNSGLPSQGKRATNRDMIYLKEKHLAGMFASMDPKGCPHQAHDVRAPI
jgi:hypothetical protein